MLPKHILHAIKTNNLLPTYSSIDKPMEIFKMNKTCQEAKEVKVVKVEKVDKADKADKEDKVGKVETMMIICSIDDEMIEYIKAIN